MRHVGKEKIDRPNKEKETPKRRAKKGWGLGLKAGAEGKGMRDEGKRKKRKEKERRRARLPRECGNGSVVNRCMIMVVVSMGGLLSLFLRDEKEGGRREFTSPV